MAELEKAYLLFEGAQGSSGDKVPCMFNPSDFSVAYSNKWEPPTARTSKSTPQLAFQGMESATLDLILFFDTTDTGTSVTDYTGVLAEKMRINPQLAGRSRKLGNVRPSTVIFRWGKLSSFPCVITSLNVKFTYFSATGVPLRAEATVKLQQYKDSRGFTKQNPTSGTPVPHRVHRVQRGETLDRISALYYGDSTRWRSLASANGIEDPLGIKPGSLLSIPELGS